MLRNFFYCHRKCSYSDAHSLVEIMGMHFKCSVGQGRQVDGRWRIRQTSGLRPGISDSQ